MRNNIPVELRSFNQWVCSGADKIPLDPKTGRPASVTDPSTWASFQVANSTGLPFVGFVLTPSDPFSIIDLDNKPDRPVTEAQWNTAVKILEAFDSYTERSAGGRGFHIIVKGKVAAGLHRDNVEVYSTARYMICTGNVVRPAPVADCQGLLDKLVGEMKPASQVELDDEEGVLSDEEVYQMAANAANGEKFDLLCKGDWAGLGYPSQSEADFALLSMFTFYTRDNEQVRRLFRYSGLGKRDKATNSNQYVDRCLRKIRAKQPQPVDLSKLALPPPLPASPPDTTNTNEMKNSEGKITFPPGLIGEMADYIYRTAIRPVPEVALVASIALAAGIVGRCYNVSGSGLNQYLILLAKTGAGKDGAISGIDRLITAARTKVPMIDQFIGPSAFASGQALIKVLDERPSFVSVLGEFGFTLRQLCDQRANSAQIMLKRVLLDLYSKSGWHKALRSSVYSDTEKNTKIVQAPNVTLLGESTPEAFFEGLDTSHIAEGLIPRFSIIEYTGPRAPRNPNAHEPPPEALAIKLAELAAIGLTMSQNNSCAAVDIEPDALALLNSFDAKADSRINGTESDVDMQLWNRAHLKALKLSALVAVGVNPAHPIVTAGIAEWGIDFIEREIEGVAKRYKEGDVGNGDHKHELEIKKAVLAYLKMPPGQRLTYQTPKKLLDQQIIPFGYIRRRCRLLASFKDDRRGAAFALDGALKDMVNAEILKLIPKQQAMSNFGTEMDLYIVGQAWQVVSPKIPSLLGKKYKPLQSQQGE